MDVIMTNYFSFGRSKFAENYFIPRLRLLYFRALYAKK